MLFRIDKRVLNRRLKQGTPICQGWLRGTCFAAWIRREGSTKQWYCGTGSLLRVHDRIRHDLSLSADAGCAELDIVASERLNMAIQEFGVSPATPAADRVQRQSSTWKIHVVIFKDLNRVSQLKTFATQRLVCDPDRFMSVIFFCCRTATGLPTNSLWELRRRQDESC